ncbi:hypothetical protein H6B51_02590 [Pseudoflavonifractor phocaeensis]|nr:hypothetical protein [Pseudoflavonifractor phocaeensis]
MIVSVSYLPTTAGALGSSPERPLLLCFPSAQYFGKRLAPTVLDLDPLCGIFLCANCPIFYIFTFFIGYPVATGSRKYFLYPLHANGFLDFIEYVSLPKV